MTTPTNATTPEHDTHTSQHALEAAAPEAAALTSMPPLPVAQAPALPRVPLLAAQRQAFALQIARTQGNRAFQHAVSIQRTTTAQGTMTGTTPSAAPPTKNDLALLLSYKPIYLCHLYAATDEQLANMLDTLPYRGSKNLGELYTLSWLKTTGRTEILKKLKKLFASYTNLHRVSFLKKILQLNVSKHDKDRIKALKQALSNPSNIDGLTRLENNNFLGKRLDNAFLVYCEAVTNKHKELQKLKQENVDIFETLTEIFTTAIKMVLVSAGQHAAAEGVGAISAWITKEVSKELMAETTEEKFLSTLGKEWRQFKSAQDFKLMAKPSDAAMGVDALTDEDVLDLTAALTPGDLSKGKDEIEMVKISDALLLKQFTSEITKLIEDFKKKNPQNQGDFDLLPSPFHFSEH